jgi:hypothetical protein
MPKYVTPPGIAALAAGGSGSTALWVATVDGSIFRLIPVSNPPTATPTPLDPSSQWIWEKMPALPTASEPAS